MIRGPAPLGPGAPARERLHAMAVAQLGLLEDHADLIAAGESGRAGARFDAPPVQFLRTHITILLQEADPRVQPELLADLLLASLTAESFVYWRRVRGYEPEQILAAFDAVVDGILG